MILIFTEGDQNNANKDKAVSECDWTEFRSDYKTVALANSVIAVDNKKGIIVVHKDRDDIFNGQKHHPLVDLDKIINILTKNHISLGANERKRH
jgi:hypothetical protein